MFFHISKLFSFCYSSPLSSPSSSLFTILLTMTSANSKANSLLLPVKDHVKALHDDSPHHCSSARLGNGKFIAVLLGWSHILYWSQVLLNMNRKRKGSEGGWIWEESQKHTLVEVLSCIGVTTRIRLSRCSVLCVCCTMVVDSTYITPFLKH